MFPVVCGSATAEVAVDRLADLICEIGPSPLDRPPVTVTAGDTTVDVAPDPDGPPLAFVFRTVADRYVGHLSLFRVLSGTIRGDDHLVNSRTGTDERLHALLRDPGRRPRSRSTSWWPARSARWPSWPTPAPATPSPPGASPSPLRRSTRPSRCWRWPSRPRTPADEDHLAPALHRLVEEDPALRVERDDETHQTLLRGVGDAHLALALERLETQHGVGVETEEVAIAYRETIGRRAEAEGRHKKQTGGHGQFAVCTLVVEPLPPRGGFEFASKVVGGAISKGHIPAVQKGVEEALAHGGPLGHPVVDVKVTVTDGKEHAVDSSEVAFRAAARLAVREALARAEPSLLEPVARVTVTVPVDGQGDVMGDLSARRGRIEGTEPGDEGEQVITAAVPEAELRRYPVELRSLTGGRGRVHVEPGSYEPVPDHLVDAARRDLAETEA